jgi:RNA polymerase sigma factor (sigma-70 family)
MRSEDGGIIHECLNGETEAFGLLVDKYKEGIYAFVYGKLRDFQNAQDVTQEVFLQAYRDLRSLRRWESFVFWLYRIASTRCKMWIRTQSRRVDREFIEDQDSTAIDDSSLDSYRDSQLSESLEEALDSLPEIQREVLMLHYFGGMNSKEIAKAIGTSPGAVRMRLTRARSQLREEMLTMMDTAFEEQRIPAGFTLRIVEAVKHIKVHPMPRATALPWGLSAAVGIIITVLSLNPHVSMTSDIAMPAGSPLPVEAKVLKSGEIPVDILKTSEISAIASKQGDGDGGEPQKPQNTSSLAPQQGKGAWRQRSDMPTARYMLGTCAVDGRIYAMGGTDQNQAFATIEVYDPATDTWTRKADMPAGRGLDGAVCAVNGKIYIIGGWPNPKAGTVLNEVKEYDPKTEKWTKKSDMPTKRAHLALCVVKGKIYAIGGFITMDVFTSAVEEYDPETDTWTKKADMSTDRAAFAAAAVNGKIYAIGGNTGKWLVGPYLSTVEEYDPVTDIWTKKADMPIERFELAASALNGKIYVVGGGSEGRSQSTVWEYDPITDTWREVADMPTRRASLSSAVVDGKIYAIGGYGPGLVPLPTVEEYDPEGLQAVSSQGKLPTKWGEVKSE